MAILHAGFVSMMIQSGIGLHPLSLSTDQINRLLLFNSIAYQLYGWSLDLVKMTLIYSMLRSIQHRHVRTFAYILLLFLLSMGIGQSVIELTRCNPYRAERMYLFSIIRT